MNQKLKEKIRESLSAVLPITGIVLMLSISLVPMELGSIVMFLTGAAMLIVGMGFFQLGAEMSMTPIGEGVGVQISKMKSLIAVLLTGFLMGVIITVSEPDLQILAFLGCLCIVKPGGESVAVFPALMGVLGGLGAGLAYTMVRKMGMYDMKGPVIVFYFSVFSTLIVIPWIVTNFVMPSPRQLIFLICAGLGAACGQFSITAAYKCAPAREISIYDYSQIIFATILGYLFFGEIPDVLSFLGYALIIGASLFMFLYNKRTISADKAKMVS